MHAFHFSSTALGLPQSTSNLYSIIFAKIINQVACYRIGNGEFNLEYLSNLINWFSLMKLPEIYQEFLVLTESHGISIIPLK